MGRPWRTDNIYCFNRNKYYCDDGQVQRPVALHVRALRGATFIAGRGGSAPPDCKDAVSQENQDLPEEGHL